MNQTSTYQLLAFVRDARLEGREADAKLVLEEIGSHVRHVRATFRFRVRRLDVWRDAPWMRRMGRADQLAVELRAWQDESPLQKLYKRRYNIQQFAHEQYGIPRFDRVVSVEPRFDFSHLMWPLTPGAD